MKEHEHATRNEPETKPAQDEVAKEGIRHLSEGRSSARTRRAELVGGRS